MTIRILAFGICKDIIGGSTGTITVPDACNVTLLKATLTERYPALAGVKALSIAIDGSYATDATIIHHASEIALIPPVSGG